VNVAIASSLTFGVAMVATVFGHRSLFELDLLAMVVLGFLGVKRSRSPQPGESGGLILLISLPAALIGSLFALSLIGLHLMALFRY